MRINARPLSWIPPGCCSGLRPLVCGAFVLVLTACGGDPGSVSSSGASSSSASSSSSSSSSSSASGSGSSSSSGRPTTHHRLVLEEDAAATCLIEGFVESDHRGFTGPGYANVRNEVDAGIVWDLRTVAAGPYQLTLRYANGGGGDRGARVQINDGPISTLATPETSGWDLWQEADLQVELAYGTNLLILRGTTAEGLANIDTLTLEGAGLAAGNCAAATIQLPDTPQVASALTFRASPLAKGANYITAFDWQFGDGHNGEGAVVSHSYDTPGLYTVSLTTTDEHGSQHRSEKVLEVFAELGPVKVFIAGDSTVSNYPDTPSPNDQAGWGQMLHEYYYDRVTVLNHAIGGRSSRRFIDEGRLEAIWNAISPGDYLLVQFGTNDGHKTATYTINGATIPYYLDPATDFRSWLRKYVEGAKTRGVNLVFVTPPPRNSAYCTGGNGTGAHAQAMRELAMEMAVPLADLNQKVVSYLMAICPSPVPENFFLLRADGSVDGTHFQEHGARVMARMVVDAIGEARLPLNLHRN